MRLKPARSPRVGAAIRRAHALGRYVEVKNYPHCLLAAEGLGDALVNDQPLLLIDPAFWAAVISFLKPGRPGSSFRISAGLTERTSRDAFQASFMSMPRRRARSMGR